MPEPIQQLNEEYERLFVELDALFLNEVRRKTVMQELQRDKRLHYYLIYKSNVDALIKCISNIKRSYPHSIEAIEEINHVMRETINVMRGTITIRAYFKLANTLSGKPSKKMQQLGLITLIIGASLYLAGIITAKLLLGPVGIALLVAGAVLFCISALAILSGERRGLSEKVHNVAKIKWYCDRGEQSFFKQKDAVCPEYNQDKSNASPGVRNKGMRELFMLLP